MGRRDLGGGAARFGLALAWLGGAIWAVGQYNLGDGGGNTIWAGLGLAGQPELGVKLWVELRLVRGLELK